MRYFGAVRHYRGKGKVGLSKGAICRGQGETIGQNSEHYICQLDVRLDFVLEL